MKTLGIYVAKKWKKLCLFFFPEYKLAFAIGPLPENSVGSRGIFAEVYAE